MAASGDSARRGAPRRGRLRSLLITSAILVGALLVAVALAEGIVRALRLVEYPPKLHKPDPTNVYVLRPGFEGKTSYGIPLSINEHGYRGRAYPRERTPGTYRILFLGDSIGFGSGLREEDSFPALLERSLNARGDAVTYEVLNFSTIGYNTTQERNLLRMRGLSFRPDLVIVAFFGNDLDPFRVPGQLDPRRKTLVRIKEVVRENLRLYPFLHGRMQRLRQLVVPKTSGDETLTAASPGFDEAIASLEQIDGLARSAGGRALVVILPRLERLDDTYPLARFHADVLAACAARGVLAGDLFPYFRGEDPAALWLRPDDGHPNARGNAIAARGIEDLIVRNALVPGSADAAVEADSTGAADGRGAAAPDAASAE